MPKVSILIPVYKVDKYLRQCLESVINQTLQDIEIVIVDEGDMDVCRSIIDEFEAKDSRIKTIHEKNGSYGIALNKAIKKATGEYLGIIESDDFTESTMFADLYEIAKKFDADIVKSDYFAYFTAKNESIKTGQISKLKSNRVTNIKEDISLLKIPPSIWSALYKREFILNNEIQFVEKLKHAYQDTSFKFKTFALADKIVLTDKAYVHYRVDSEGSTCNNGSNVYSICDEYVEITEFLENHRELKEILNTRKLINEYNAYIWNLKRINKEFRQEFIYKFSEIFNNYKNKNEIKDDFFKKVSKKEFNLLIKNPDKYRKMIDKKLFFNKLNNLRKEMFTIRLNSSRIYIRLFGIKLLEVN